MNAIEISAVTGDLNGNGRLDLFVAGYVDINNQISGATMGFPNTNYGVRDLLFLNGGDDASGRPVFQEVGEIVGLETADFEYGLGSLLTDLDGDGDLDLYVANDTNPNRLYKNIGWAEDAPDDPEGLGFRLKELGQAVGVGDNNSGMGVASGDFDLDGDLNLMVVKASSEK